MLRFVIAVLLFSALSAHAAGPYCVADAPAKCDRCVWDGTGFGPLVNDVVVDTVRGVAAYSNRICMRDVGGALVGTNNITLACRDSTSLWGDSAIVPFSFVRPASTSIPIGIRLAP